MIYPLTLTSFGKGRDFESFPSFQWKWKKKGEEPILRMSRILVIGAKGMLGRALVSELHHSLSEYDVLAWDIEEIDIRKREETIAKIEEVHPSVVVNLAAYTDVDGCETNVQEAFLVNSDGMRHIAEGVRRCKGKAVYLSTDYVFDGQKKTPYVEEDLPNPLNIYGHSKWRGEQAALELEENGLVVRTQWLYGPNGKNFVAAILRQAREKLRPSNSDRVLSIVDDQFGSPTFTVDLSQAIALMIRRRASGIYHVTNSHCCSWYEFGQAILSFCGIEAIKVNPIPSCQLDRKAIRPSYSVLSNEKLKRETGIQLRPWPEALKDFLLHLQRQGELDWVKE